jgi:retron-type reverse transcriptase
MNWVINGDISKCFDSIPHKVIMELISKKISCHRTLELVQKAISGYIVSPTGDRTKNTMGTPQGSVLSPILSNIV